MKIEKQNNYLIFVIFAFVTGLCILFKSISDVGGEIVSPLAPTPTVTPTPAIDPTSDPLTYIRWKGQQEGYDDYAISGFIRLARAESHFNLNQYAKNPTSTAKGIFQFIDGTWRAYCLEDGNVYDFVDNIDCFYKVLATDGYPKGLSHWSESLVVAGLN